MRKVSIWLAPTVVAATVLVLALSGVAQASRHVSPSVKRGASPNHVAAVPSHKLLKSNLVGGFSGVSAPAGTFTAVDAPTKLACPATKAPCTIEATIGVEYGDGAGDLFAECLVVDGSQYDNNGCAWAGPSHGSGLYNTPVQEQIATVGAGTHTVQTEVLSDFTGTTIFYYTLTYRIYS